MEEAPTTLTDKEFSIPHKGVVKESSETIKSRVVYDASAKENPSSPSLNECLYPRLTHQFIGGMFQQRTTAQTLLAEAVPYPHHCGSRARNGSMIQHSDQRIRSQIHKRVGSGNQDYSRPRLHSQLAKSNEPTTDELDKLLERNTLRRTLRASAWINRFIHNCRAKEKRWGPLDTEEIETEKYWWIRRIQNRDTVEQHYKETSAQLGLETDDRGIIVCIGRMQGIHPIYLPWNAVFTEKLVHGNVGLTMAAVRETFWIHRLRSLVKMIRLSSKMRWSSQALWHLNYLQYLQGELEIKAIYITN